MNKAYNYKSKYESYESNCNIIKIDRDSDSASALDAVGKLLERIASKNILFAIKAIITTICFFGFIGVIGSVENETISLGTGIITSLFLVFIEILCFKAKKKL